MTPSFAAAILAGGSSKRMGSDKALLLIEHQLLLDRIYSELSQVFSQISVIGKPRPSSKISPACFVPDLIEGIGPMSGLYTALNIFSEPVLVVPCDMPNLNAGHIRKLLSAFQPGYRQAIVARGVKGIEPLFAVYTQDCREILNSLLVQGEYALYKLIERLKVRFVNFTAEDKNSDIFFNINTLSDYKRALYMKNDFKASDS